MIIVGLGFLSALLGVFGALALFGHGAPGWGLLILLLVIGQVIVLYGLLKLRAWALALALVFYGLGILVDLVQLDVLGVVIGIVIVTYLLLIAERFD